MNRPDTRDARGRPLHDLRVSVTDRCNFRCVYCMPREKFGADHEFLRRDDLLTFDEITRVVTAAHELGVRKVRLTGGEPLLRPGIADLVAAMKELPALEVAMTTNGSLLAARASELADAGLDRVTVSLDSLDPATFRRMTDSRVSLDDVVTGIDAAVAAGLAPVKVNVVVRADSERGDLVAIARHFRATPVVVRFIEYMDVGSTNAWSRTDVMNGADIVAAIDADSPLEPLPATVVGEVARRYRHRDGSGEIGVITSVSAPFCGDCTRLRLAANGDLFTCLFANSGTGLRELVRSGADHGRLVDALRDVWTFRSDRYSELRAERGARRDDGRVEMSYIGG
ncbi:MAG: GTP 3',8-cyclase MoaA [Gordonia paraffinivorans]